MSLVIYLQLIFRNFSVNASSSSEVEDTTRAGRIPVKVDEGVASLGWTTSGFLKKNNKGTSDSEIKINTLLKPNEQLSSKNVLLSHYILQVSPKYAYVKNIDKNDTVFTQVILAFSIIFKGGCMYMNHLSYWQNVENCISCIPNPLLPTTYTYIQLLLN